MKPYVHFLSYLVHFFLEWMFQTKVLDIIKTHFLCSIHFFVHSRAVYEIIWRNIVEPVLSTVFMLFYFVFKFLLCALFCRFFSACAVSGKTLTFSMGVLKWFWICPKRSPFVTGENSFCSSLAVRNDNLWLHCRETKLVWKKPSQKEKGRRIKKQMKREQGIVNCTYAPEWRKKTADLVTVASLNEGGSTWVCGYLGLLLNLAALIQHWDRLCNFMKPVSAEGVEQHGE